MTNTSSDEIKALQAVAAALDPLEDDERARVLSWAGSKYGISVKSGAKTPPGGGEAPNVNQGATFEDFSDLYNAASPKSDVQRALVAGYWFQVEQGQATFPSQTLNDALKDLGHGISNITKSMTTLQQQKPALATQVKKAGKSKQARKVYKLTKAGTTAVERMLAGEPDEE